MKYKILAIQAIITFFILSFQPVSYGTASKAFKVKINDNPISFTISPRIDNGNLILPLREVAELSGFEVMWNPELKTAVCSKSDKIIKVTKDSTYADIDGKKTTLSLPVVIIEGRIFIPADLIQKGMDMDVKLLEKEETVCFFEKKSAAISISGNNNLIVKGSNVIANITTKNEASRVARQAFCQ